MLLYLDSILYIVLTAISFVFIDKIGDSINPVLSLFVMAILASVWFNLINWLYLKKVYISCYKNKILYLKIAFSVGINWICSIFAPNLADPFIYLSTLFITMAVCAFLHKIITERNKYLRYILSIFLLVSCYIFIFYYYRIANARNLSLGVSLGCIAGVTSYSYAIYSGLMQKITNFSSTQILAVRFWPLNIGLGLYLIFTHTVNINFHQFGVLFIMTIITLILPVFFLQQAVNKLGVIRYSLVVSLTPVCTFTVYSIANEKVDFINLLICLLITTALILPKISLVGIINSILIHQYGNKNIQNKVV